MSPKFIKLTGVFGPDDPHPIGPVYINLGLLAGFSRPSLPEFTEDDKETTVLMLSGDKDNSIFVSETPEQILALIEGANT
jgi:hypothetical protein